MTIAPAPVKVAVINLYVDQTVIQELVQRADSLEQLVFAITYEPQIPKLLPESKILGEYLSEQCGSAAGQVTQA